MSYIYVLCTIILTVYGQLIIKWRVIEAGALPENGGEKLCFLLQLLFSPWIVSAFLAALLASVTWIAAMTKLQLSHAYPFMSLAFILVMLFSSWLFNETITTPKLVGATLVILGLIVGAQG